MERGIQKFLIEWRKANLSVTPKIHFLEDHAVPQMRYLGYALGKYNEQGGESLHALVNRIKPRYGNLVSLLLALFPTVSWR